MTDPRSFAEFWPDYVRAHSQPMTRLLHTCGTLLGCALLVAAIFLRRPWLVPGALTAPYALAWFSHFFIEHNRPASFGHPLWSWLADQKMVVLVLLGKMGAEVRKCSAPG